MGNYEDLKNAIANLITTNGNNEITGAILNRVLQNIISNVGIYATFAGIATPETNPGTPDQNIFYIAITPGVYVNFGSIIIEDGGNAILTNKTGTWVKQDLGFATSKEIVKLNMECSLGIDYDIPVGANRVVYLQDDGNFSNSTNNLKKFNQGDVIKITTDNYIGAIISIHYYNGVSRTEIGSLRNGIQDFIVENFDISKGEYLAFGIENTKDGAIPFHMYVEGFLKSKCDYVTEQFRELKRIALVKEEQDFTQAEQQQIRNNINAAEKKVEVVLDCFQNGKNLINPDEIIKGQFLKPTTGKPSSYATASTTGFIPVTPGKTYIISGAARQSEGAAGFANESFENPVKLDPERNDFYMVNNKPFIIPDNVNYIVVTLSLDNFDNIYKIMVEENNVVTPFEPYGLFLKDNQIENIKERLNDNEEDGDVSIFANKQIAFMGDSSTALPDVTYYDHSWVEVCCDIIKPKNYRLYARSGSTLRTRYDDNGNLQKCLLEQINRMISENYTPDIIVIQMGGNDISDVNNASLVGTEADVKKLNYRQCKNIMTIYGSIGYCVGYLKELYPNTLVVMGTVFQRAKTGVGTECETIAEIEKACAQILSLPIIDGFSDSGISAQYECETASAYMCWDGMESGQTAPDFGHPIYNYVNPTNGEILTKEAGVIDASAIKVYGLYTWDGTHQKISGINKIGRYMAATLKTLY